MIAIYKGEDTEFAGQEPFQININTPLDLTGYTAKLMFGNVVKEFDAEEVGTKTLRLSFSAEDTLDFYPGQGYASVKVFDTEGRVAVLKRFVIDVRFRRPEDSAASMTDVSEVVQSFENIRAAVADIPTLTEDDDIEKVKEVLNTMLEAAKTRSEFSLLTDEDIANVSQSSVLDFVNCIRNIESLATDAKALDADSSEDDVKNRLNGILAVFGDGGVDGEDTERSVTSVGRLSEMSREVNKVLRSQDI